MVLVRGVPLIRLPGDRPAAQEEDAVVQDSGDGGVLGQLGAGCDRLRLAAVRLAQVSSGTQRGDQIPAQRSAMRQIQALVDRLGADAVLG